MTSSKLSSRRQTRGTPPVCRKPPPPLPPSYPAHALASAHHRYLVHSRLPPIPAPPFEPITTRNLIFHCYAHRANDAATRALHQLRLRWDLFNGRKIIAVAADSHTLPLNQIRRLLPPDVDYFILPNDPRLRETASFPTLLREVRSLDERSATFYAHTKGASPTHNQAPTISIALAYWALRMFHHLLDDWPAVDQVLQSHASAGTYLIDYSHIPNFIMESPTGAKCGNWHYAGAFFWFRHDCVFRNPAWSALPDDPYAPEMWLGSLLPRSQASSLFQPFDPQQPNPAALYESAVHNPPVPGPPP